MSENTYRFMVTGPFEVEEVVGTSRKILKGLFLKLDSATGNGRTYQVAEAEQICSSLLGMPVFYGAKIGFDPTLLKIGWKHLKRPLDQIGRVIRAVHDKVAKVIRGAIEIYNTETNPSIVQEVGPGWGFSIGGEMRDFTPTGRINKRGNPIVKVIGMIANHLQLLSPKTPRGQQEAQVEGVQPVEETIMFDPCLWGFCTITDAGITVRGSGEEYTVPIEETTTDVLQTDTEVLDNGTNVLETGDVLPNEVPPQPRIIRKIIRKVIIVEDPDTTILYQ